MTVVWAEVVTEVVGRLFSWLPSSPGWLAVWGSHFEYAVLSSPSQVKVVVSAWSWMSFVPVVATCSTWLGRPTAFPPSVADAWLVARLRSPRCLTVCLSELLYRGTVCLSELSYRGTGTVWLSMTTTTMLRRALLLSVLATCQWLHRRESCEAYFCFRYFSFDRLDRPTDLDLLIALDFKPAIFSLTLLTFYRCTCWYFVFVCLMKLCYCYNNLLKSYKLSSVIVTPINYYGWVQSSSHDCTTYGGSSLLNCC